MLFGKISLLIPLDKTQIFSLKQSNCLSLSLSLCENFQQQKMGEWTRRSKLQTQQGLLGDQTPDEFDKKEKKDLNPKRKKAKEDKPKFNNLRGFIFFTKIFPFQVSSRG